MPPNINPPTLHSLPTTARSQQQEHQRERQELQHEQHQQQQQHREQPRAAIHTTTSSVNATPYIDSGSAGKPNAQFTNTSPSPPFSSASPMSSRHTSPNAAAQHRHSGQQQQQPQQQPDGEGREPSASTPPSSSTTSTLRLHHFRSLSWRPSPVVALAPSLDGTAVAAARDDGDIEIWRVAAGSVGWACEQRVRGHKGAAISCLLWCPGDQGSGSSAVVHSRQNDGGGRGRLLSAGLDGHITEWDLQRLRPAATTDSFGGAVWAMALQPRPDSASGAGGASGIGGGARPGTRRRQQHPTRQRDKPVAIGDGEDEDDTDEESSDEEGEEDSEGEERTIAVACDDGCVRLFALCASGGGGGGGGGGSLVYQRSFPRVRGRMLSLAWDPMGARVFSGASDGCVRCWDAASARELYRMTAGIGGQVPQRELCIWSLVALRDGTLASGDSNGCVQFWDTRTGTLLSAHARHHGDVLALAATPAGDAVFAASIDGKVLCYKRLREPIDGAAVAALGSAGAGGGDVVDSWACVGGRQSHSHDVRALAIALMPLPEDGEDVQPLPSRRQAGRAAAPAERRKWQRGGIPMLVSGGNDAQMMAYPASAFLAYHPFPVCPCPQPPALSLALGLSGGGGCGGKDVGVEGVFGEDGVGLGKAGGRRGGGRVNPLLLVQQALWVDVWSVGVPVTSPPQVQGAAISNASQSHGLKDWWHEAAARGVVRRGKNGVIEGSEVEERLAREQGYGNGDVAEEVAAGGEAGGRKRKADQARHEGLEEERSQKKSKKTRRLAAAGAALGSAAFGSSAALALLPPSMAAATLAARQSNGSPGPALVARIKVSGPDHVTCSAMSPDGRLVALSDRTRVRVYELEECSGARGEGDGNRNEGKGRAKGKGKGAGDTGVRSDDGVLGQQQQQVQQWSVRRRKLEQAVPCALEMVFSADSRKLFMAAPSGSVMLLDLDPHTPQSPHHRHAHSNGPVDPATPPPTLRHWHPFADSTTPSASWPLAGTPAEAESEEGAGKADPAAAGGAVDTSLSSVPVPEGGGAVTLLECSSDCRWLAAANSRGQLAVFDLEHSRHHWSVPALDAGAGVTAAAFHPGGSLLVVATSANGVHLLDLRRRCLSDWSRRNGAALSLQLLQQQQLQGTIAGLALPPSPHGTTLLAHTHKQLCFIDFRGPLQPPQPSKGAAKESKAKFGRVRVVECKDQLVLRAQYVADDTLMLVDKAWADVLKSLPAPIFRHRYGT